MMSAQSFNARPWLLIEGSKEGVLRFATVAPSARPRVEQVREIAIASLPTFTDALQQFERESGVPLQGLECAIAMAGAASGEMLSMVRSRWTITRNGLAAVFGRPVTVLNDVGARVWATRCGTANVQTVRGTGALSLDRPGRYLMIMVEEGVGAAAIDVDRESGIRILETEAGHMDFPPSNEREERLAKALRGASPFVSWERLLMLDQHDPVWNQACPELLEPERSRVLAAILGRFSVNVMHAAGAWQGVILTGSRIPRMIDAGNRAYFETAFGTRRNFSRLILGAPVWRVDQHEAVLTGAAQCLARDFEFKLRNAA
jgi:glucokinase